MATSFSRYVDITSGVGAGFVVNRRDLIGRLFTDNALVPTGSLIEFTSATDVGTYFGTSSTEYLRALFYFSFVSKNITSADRIGFYRWTDASVAPHIFGARFTTILSAFQAISTGAFSLTLGAITHIITGIDFTATTSLADVAGVLQTKIRAADAAAQWASATVTYNSTTGSFNFVGGAVAADAVSATTAGSGVEIIGLIGWTDTAVVPFNAPVGAIYSNGKLIETITQVLNASIQTSTNFGSFLFMPSLSTNQITEAATWNSGQNVSYQYYIPVTASNRSAISAAIINLAGNGMTMAPLSTEYPEMLPMAILAATDYSHRNATQNYMFQSAALTPSVTTDAEADICDDLSVNYYGQTQEAGQFINFYQRGVLTGLADDPTDMNTYANEQWLKSEAGAAIMQLLIALPEVAANQKGRGQLLATLQDVIQLALTNGTISVGKPLTNTQKLYISEITGDPDAYFQVQQIGYWVNVVIDAANNLASYILVYSKDDVVRKVDGQHVLI